jgi:glycosyltransferase involved in cell wall biosynthesis
MSRLAIITTHPVQYNAPLFKMLALLPGLEVKVFYTLGRSYSELKDKGFGKPITWDIPLLDGYTYEFIENTSKNPGSYHFRGVENPAIIDKVEAFKPTVVLVYGWSFVSHLKVMRYFKNRIPVYFRGDSTLLDEQKGLKVLFRRLFLRWVYRHIDKALYVGTRNKQYFLQHGLKMHNLVFAPHAIDNKRFSDGVNYNEESKRIRAEAGISEHNVVFLFAGKLENKKSPLLLIKAFNYLQVKNSSLLLVGNGILEESLRAAAKGNKNIHFLQFQNQSEMPAVYRAADVFVLPSGGPGETWGLAVNEAMACGLPVIVSDKVGCTIDLVQEGINGYIFGSGNLKSLTEKLYLCAAMSKAELHDLGRASRLIINNWSFEQVSVAIALELLKLES